MTTPQWPMDNPLSCPLVHAINIIGGKWKPIIIHMLLNGTHRFGQMKRAIPPISTKMLTQQLRELEADGVVARTVFAEVPPRVEYQLTAAGLQLAPALLALYQWGQEKINTQHQPPTT